MSSLLETRYATLLDDGRIQCDLCPRRCRLHDGQRGLCSVRGAARGRIWLLTYGLASGFCVDPVEKKPLYHFLPGTPILSFGQTGCNLTCRFCQNYSISKANEKDLDTLLRGAAVPGGGEAEFARLSDTATPEMIARAAKRMGCRSVAFTYNDPVIFMEFAIDVAQACHVEGIRAVAVTAGYIEAAPRVEFFRHIDAANVDLKAFTESFYKRLCTGSLEAVKDTLVYLKHETDVWVEITTLLIPEENDSPAEIEALCRWVTEALGPDVPVHFSAFHPDWKMTDRPRTPSATLRRAREIACAAGIRYAYVGNVHDPEYDSSYCHACGALLIGRDWFELTIWNLDDHGCCRHCGTPFAGVIDGPPGAWGRQRRPVRIVDGT